MFHIIITLIKLIKKHAKAFFVFIFFSGIFQLSIFLHQREVEDVEFKNSTEGTSTDASFCFLK